MIYILFLFTIFLLFYSVRYRPGMFLAYILFFPKLNNILFSKIGFGDYRYVTILILFPFMIGYLYHKTSFYFLIKRVFKSRITLSYLILTLYVIIYGNYLGTEYEWVYINTFIYPTLFLFFIAGIFMFSPDIQKDFFIGVGVFMLITFFVILTSGNYNPSDSQERLLLYDDTGMGAIFQGRLAGLFVVFSFLLVILQRSFYRRIGFLLLLISGFWLLSVGSRGPLVAVFCTFIFYYIYNREKSKMMQSILLFLLFFIPIIFIFDFSDTLLISRFFDLGDLGIENTKRYYRWILFFEILPDHFLYGLGPGGWGREVMIGDYRYPHNIIIESVSEFGLLGFFTIMIIVLSCFRVSRRVIKNQTSNIYQIFLVCCWVYLFINTMFSGSLMLGNEMFLISSAILIGVSFSINNPKSFTK